MTHDHVMLKGLMTFCRARGDSQKVFAHAHQVASHFNMASIGRRNALRDMI